MAADEENGDWRSISSIHVCSNVFSSNRVLKKIGVGSSAVHSVTPLTLGRSSGLDLRVVRSSPVLAKPKSQQ